MYEKYKDEVRENSNRLRSNPYSPVKPFNLAEVEAKDESTEVETETESAEVEAKAESVEVEVEIEIDAEAEIETEAEVKTDSGVNGGPDGENEQKLPMDGETTKNLVPVVAPAPEADYIDKIKSLTNYRRIVCTNYFEFVKVDGEKFSACCRCCNVIVKDGFSCCSNLLRHLRVS